MRLPSIFSGHRKTCCRSKRDRSIPRCYRLEASGWVAASWELSEKGKRARYYRLTPKGRRQLASEHSKWDAFARAMGLLLKPADEEGR